jgi:hypothetical protein
LPKSLAVARVGFIAWKWFTEGTKSVAVVLGNHPCSVSSTAAPLALSVRLAAVAAEEALVTMGKGINH